MSNDTVPFCILLPFCVESKEEYFFSILRSIIARAKIDDNHLDSAVKDGMMMQTFEIEPDDLDRWEKPKSTQQNIKRAMMIGFWAIDNFPSLGKKICGDSWNAPQRLNIEVNGKASITPKEFDAHIFAKLEIRIIELRLCAGTLNRFKCFIKVPHNLKKINKIELTKKVCSYNVANGLDRQCWDALRSGVFTISNDDANIEVATHSPEILTNSNTDSYSEIERSHLAKRRRQDRFTEGDATTNTLDQRTNESCRVASSNDIGIVSHQIERDNGQLLYRQILKEKDDAIDQLSKTAAELQKEIEVLKMDKVSLSVQVDGNARLVDALQKGLEANLKLSVKYEAEVAVHKGLIGTIEQTVAAKDKELENLQSTIDRLQSQSNSSNSDAVPELKTIIENLQRDITESKSKYIELETIYNQWKVYGTTKNRELEEEKDTVKELTSRVEKFELSLKEATAKNEKLESMLSEWKMYGTTKDKEVEKCQWEINRLQHQIDSMQKEESILLEMKNRTEAVEKDMTELTAKNEKLQVMVNEWKGYGAMKDKKLEEAQAKIDYLEKKVGLVNHQISGIVPVMEKKMEELGRDLKESIDKNGALTKELQEAKMLIDSLTAQEQNPTISEHLTENEETVSLLEVSNATDAVNVVDAVESLEHRNEVETFETDDPVVKLCRPILLEQRFGWMKFSQTKNCRPWPGFLYATDDDGKRRAQRVTSNGYVSSTKFEIFEFSENVPKKEKAQAGLAALKKFNETFKLNFD